jgi:hypothetical protein
MMNAEHYFREVLVNFSNSTEAEVTNLVPRCVLSTVDGAPTRTQYLKEYLPSGAILYRLLPKGISPLLKSKKEASQVRGLSDKRRQERKLEFAKQEANFRPRGKYKR